ncbi:MAG: hypothetical protein KBG92_00480 [Spirochaetes bacterium]|nr:hypothetical protein [Spirochaetota bacterium]HOE20294.1 hypothetical protein [Spirochaetota bacterium]HQL42385.1 hypothetical protein [Spirochaetota bacterium]
MNYNEIFKLTADTRWNVVAQDENMWRVGIYHPEYNSAREIDRLEKHSCPELFICVNGQCGLLLREGNREHQLIMNPLEAIMVTSYHNGFKVDNDGFFIVAERTDFTTHFIERDKP